MVNIFAWNEHSEGAKALADAMSIKRIKHENSKYKGNPKKIVINWGSSNVPAEVGKSKVINKAEIIKLCSDKLAFFDAIAGKNVSIPDWTTDSDVALRWIAEGHTVCARTILNGHSAKGLIILDKDNPDKFVKAPLYTKYIPKVDEYRVHVVNGKIIDVQRKALRPGWIDEHGADVNYKVRNLENGFIYVRNNVNAPKTVTDEALKAVEAIGLDFGAVDVVFNKKRDLGYVLEINSAPGLEGTSVENYAKALADYV